MPAKIAAFAPQEAKLLNLHLRTREERRWIRHDAQAQGPTLEKLRGGQNGACDECGAVYPNGRLLQYDSGVPPKGTKRFQAVLCDYCLKKYRP